MLIAGAFFNARVFVERETLNYENSEEVEIALWSISGKIDEIIKHEQRIALTDTLFEAMAFKDMLKDNGESALEKRENGVFVVKVKGNKVDYPEGVDPVAEITPEALKEDRGIINADATSDERYFAAFSSAGSGYYAVKVVKAAEFIDFQALLMLSQIEKAYDAQALLLDEYGKVIYADPELDLEGVDFRGTNGPDVQAITGFTDKHAPYFVQAEVNNHKYTLIFVFRKMEVIRDALQVSLMVTMVAAVLFGMIIAWVLGVRNSLISKAASPEQAERYKPESVRKSYLKFGVLASTVILLASLFTNSIGNLYSVTWDAENALPAVDTMIEEQANMNKQVIDKIKDNNVRYTQMISDMLVRHPKLRKEDQLSILSEELSANYIMIYDHDGNELLTDSDYINMSLGSPYSESHPLRRILKGEELMTLDMEKDNVTGTKSSVVGVRMPSIEEEHPENYNALVISFMPPEKAADDLIDAPGTFLMSLVSSYNQYLLIDKDKKILVFGTEPMNGADPVELGMEESDIRGGFMGTFTLDNKTYYGVSKEIDGMYYYYTIPVSELYRGSLKFGLNEMIVFILALFILYLVITRDQKKLYDEYVESSERGEIPDGEILDTDEYMTPEDSARSMLRILGGICVFAVAVVAVSGIGDIRRDNLIRFVFSDYWNKGFNLFALLRIIVMICIAIVIWKIVSSLILITCSMLDTKGETIARLIRNILGYAVVLGLIYYTALYLGFNPSTLLASVGVIGIAISLGAKDIISDVFAGISIVFEGAFHVGDKVVIDGVEGIVQEIGVRNLKLIGDDGTVKIIRNSTINKIMNTSKHNHNQGGNNGQSK